MLYVIPIKGQYVQCCNYLVLKELGVIGSESLELEKNRKWIELNHLVEVSFNNETDLLIDCILK